MKLTADQIMCIYQYLLSKPMGEVRVMVAELEAAMQDAQKSNGVSVAAESDEPNPVILTGDSPNG